MSDVLERVRMCVAEAGYDPELIEPSTDPGSVFQLAYDGAIPNEVVWRARELSTTRKPICLECCLAARFLLGDAFRVMWRGCLADRRLVLDCGRDR